MKKDTTVQTYNVKGMHCASCVSLIQKKVSTIPGVVSCTVNLASEKATVTYANAPVSLETLNAPIKPFEYALESPVDNHVGLHEEQSGMDHKNHGMNSSADDNSGVGLEMKVILAMVTFSFVMMFWEVLSSWGVIPKMSETWYEVAHHLMPIFATFVLFGIGRKYIRAVWIFLHTGTASMDTLVGISTIIAFVYSFIISAFALQLGPYVDVKTNYYEVVVVVIGLIAFGQLLEQRARRKTNESLQKLAQLTSKYALVERGGSEIEVPIDKVEVNDVVIIKPNERIPVDGKVVSGNSSVDESNLTGESIPVDKTEGDSVLAGTQNLQGRIKVLVQKDAGDSALAVIINIVEDAQNSKAPIERAADKISGVFVYVVIAIAFVTFLVWAIAGIVFGYPNAFALGIAGAMAVLVIACPCSLGLATPTAIITGVGVGAQHGILIKNAQSLEGLAKVQAIVFDKTGTLTENKLKIEGIFCQEEGHVCTEKDRDEKRAIIYSITQASAHPISRSIAQWLRDLNTKAVPLNNIEEVPGKGVHATSNGVPYYLGSLAYIASELNQKTENVVKRFPKERYETGRELYLANDREVLSLIKIHDTIKPDAAEAVARLKALGLKIVMATGDHKKTGESVAAELGIDEVYSEVKPGDKLSIVMELQKDGLKVAMIGDGVNDSPALTQADVAISMSNGSDIAIESSDIVLLNGDIHKVAATVNLARKTNKTIWQNLTWSFGYNAIGIPIAAGLLYPFTGLTLSPALAGAIMAFESITVVVNSLRLKRVKI